MARGEGAAGATAGVKAAEAPALPPGRRGGRPWPGVTFVLGDTAAVSEVKGLSIRQTVIETTSRQSFIGTPTQVADALDEFVTLRAADGFILVPQFTPGGLDDFVERVVPLLQERGAFRTEYSGHTLREHLGLARPEGKG